MRFPVVNDSAFPLPAHFLKNAPIILLDEATASLDVRKHETLIQTALSRLIADRTVLVIAHRMRTVAGADKIVVLSKGVVEEEDFARAIDEEKRSLCSHGKIADGKSELEANIKFLFYREERNS